MARRDERRWGGEAERASCRRRWRRTISFISRIRQEKAEKCTFRLPTLLLNAMSSE